MSDTNPTTPVRSAFDDPMNGTTAQDNTPKPSSSRQRRAHSTSPASPSARGGRTGPNPESSLPPSATSSRGTSRSRQTRARTDSNTSDNIPDDDIKGFFDQGFSKMFHRSDALETKLDKLLESNKDLNKSLQGVTNSIEGMATSIVDALKLCTSGEQPKPNSEGQSSDNTPPHQPTNPSQSSSNVWAEPVPSPPDRTPSHRNPQNVERSLTFALLHSKYVQSSKTLEEQDRKARKQTVDARKRNTYNMRGEAINLFEALQRFRKLWNILGVDGTSSDEEVLIEGQRQYQNSQPSLGAANPSESFAGNLMCYTFPRAQKGRIPMEKFRLGGCSPIMGLPINCYNPESDQNGGGKVSGLYRHSTPPTSSIDFSLPEDLERLIELTLKGDDGDAV
ncbi:hypothetical protein BT96DRAFT_1003682 [Gymnopus androsaceus JB14]|uniref:Uncharacterized protein n=1 Tax=Gymnopus androsaceus JB14 TaxID=1447944 RepID=A0A6A4GV67_9AGAR|nr:hypothetical protein BT96DRAFT_1003682 [Gymnopus androsaceus JB14]